MKSMILKNVTMNGYKCMKLVVFNDAAVKLSKLNVGTVIGLINPKGLKATTDESLSFGIEGEF